MYLPGTRVLVADHDQWTRVLLSDLLTQAGCDVRAASNGMAALRAACETQPHVALIGMALPEIGALDVLRELSADARTAATTRLLLLCDGQLGVECLAAADGVVDVRAGASQAIAALVRGGGAPTQNGAAARNFADAGLTGPRRSDARRTHVRTPARLPA